jgi:hypothetical protein
MALTSKTKKHDHAALMGIYTEAETCDKDIFADQRSNLLLVNGDHYQKKTSSFFKRIRDSQELSETQKIRLTKNHIQKIVKIYTNNLLSLAPGVAVEPKNESELDDQKSAEMNQAVWQDMQDRLGVPDLVDEWADDFVTLGEVAVKVFWDPSAGKVKAYDQKLADDGQPLFMDPQGGETDKPQYGDDGASLFDPAPGTPKYSGDIVFETIHGFNLLRDPEAKDLSKSPYLIVRKMTDVKELQAKFPEYAEKIKPGPDQTMVVFDAQRGGYQQVKNQVMLREIYFRSCVDYPRGYFYFFVDQCIIAQGELPGGIFPIRTKHMDRVQTSPRGRSIVKIMKPYQAEINRTASKMAEHQITLGDDKLLIQNGTKISAGTALPGIRSVNFTGMQPAVLAGRAGDQYLNYMNSQIEELYRVMDVLDNEDDKKEGQMDPYTLLFRAASQKKRFTRYVRRFESFLVDVADTALELAKIHMSDDAVIYATGRKEQINIGEFKNSTPLCYQIKLTAQAEDIESKLGKQLVMNHALQYVGNKLEREDIGKLIRSMPYGNAEESFDDLTIDYDSGTNLILALDKGRKPPLSRYDNFPYLIKRLTGRMRKADFRFLPPPVQQTYDMAVQKMEHLEAQRQEAIQRAKNEYIPTGGHLVSLDLYVADPQNPSKTRRARLPYQALDWLIKQLETQGMGLDQLERMNQGALAEMSGMMTQPTAGGAPTWNGRSSGTTGTRKSRERDDQ